MGNSKLNLIHTKTHNRKASKIELEARRTYIFLTELQNGLLKSVDFEALLRIHSPYQYVNASNSSRFT